VGGLVGIPERLDPALAELADLFQPVLDDPLPLREFFFRHHCFLSPPNSLR
jgi:hypothetical protein